jgi:hypothetical protein
VLSRVIVLAFLVLVGVPAHAQQWAKKMFSKTAHDFGTVARGAKTEFRFPIKNLYVEDVHIAHVQSSCGCTSPEVTKRDLKTYETGYLVATFNTHAFTGYRSATVTVTFDRPYRAEVQLQVSGNIRGDITVQPNFVNLGTVNQGQAVERAVTVTQSTRPDWKITDVRSSNTNFEVDVIEIGRQRGNASYNLRVKLKETAPAGYIKDQLVLVTNDPQSGTFPIEVEGRVIPEITVVQMINFGSLELGGKTTKPLIVQGQKPFTITDIKCDDERFSFKVPEAGEKPKKVYSIPVTFTAGGDPGRVSRKILIETDRSKSNVPAVMVIAEVRPGVTPSPVSTETPVSKRDEASTEAATSDDSRSADR